MKKPFLLLFLVLVPFLCMTSTNTVACTTFALIDLWPTGFPEILSDTTGTYSYDAVSDLFTSSATPVDITFDGVNGIFIYDGASPASFSVQFYVDKYGQFAGGIPAANDLEIYGAFSYGGTDYDGLLLAGEVTAFGAKDLGLNRSAFDFTFDTTGGLLFGSGLFPESGYNFMATISDFQSFNNNHSGSQTVNVTSAVPIPIPSALILLGSGLIGCVGIGFRKIKRKTS